jgi:hypothetical protein
MLPAINTGNVAAKNGRWYNEGTEIISVDNFVLGYRVMGCYIGLLDNMQHQ